MISQSELDRALARWKARKQGHNEAPTPSPAVGYAAVIEESTVIQSAEGAEVVVEGSGLINIGDGEYEEQSS
jgi:hypothetical protein